MGAIDKIRQTRKDEAEKLNPTAELKGPTLKQIVADQEQFRLFGVYLEEEGEQRLGLELGHGEAMDQDSLDRLTEKRRGFLEIIERAKTISENLDLKSLQDIIDTSPELKKIAERNGPEGIREVVRRHLPEVAIRDRQRFEDLSEKIRSSIETKKNIAEDNKKIAAFCNKYGIAEKDYIEAIESGDPEELGKIVRDSMSKFKRLRATWFNKKARADLQDELDSLVDIDRINEHLSGLDRDLAEIGGSLQSALINNGTLHKALVADLRGEKAEKPEPDMAFSEVKESPKEEDVQAKWEQYQLDHQDEHRLNGTSREDAVRSFSREYTANTTKGKKKGFWASIFDALFASRVESMIK